MLKFYGIFQNSKGFPERYSIKIDLLESLNAAMVIHDHLDGDPGKTNRAIQGEIEKLYSASHTLGNSKTGLRQTAAKWFRCKDIVRFLFSDPEFYPLKLQTIQTLISPKNIEEKWNAIETNLAPVVHDKGIDYLQWKESPLDMILEMVILAFLDQDSELPPANLELHFIKNDFPKVTWKKREHFHRASNPFWKPKNPYCRIAYLLSRLYSEAGKQATTSMPAIVSDLPQPPETRQETLFTPLQSQIMEFPEHKIEIELEGDDEPTGQMEIFPKNASETLLSLQKLVQKNFSHEGVKHLLLIIRQFSARDSKGIFQFHDEKHLSSITGKATKSSSSAKQRSILGGVLGILERVRITRTYCLEGETEQRQVSTVLISKIGQEQRSLKKELFVRTYLLDPLFFPATNNPFCLGQHLNLMPKTAFQVNSRTHALVPGLSAYFSGVWIYELRNNPGVLEKKATEIMEGCAFNVTPSNRVRLYRKLNEELGFMKQKNLIHSYSLQESRDKNPMDAIYQITASEVIQKKLISYVSNPQLSYR